MLWLAEKRFLWQSWNISAVTVSYVKKSVDLVALDVEGVVVDVQERKRLLKRGRARIEVCTGANRKLI